MTSKTVKRIGWALLALVLLVAVPLTIMRYHAVRRMEAALAAGRQIGLVARMAEVSRMLDQHHGAVASTENGAPLYVAAGAELEDVEFPDPEEDAALPVVDDALRALVETARPALSLLEQAAARPRCRHDVRWEDGVSMRLEFIHGTLKLRSALLARIAVRLADWDSDGALADAARLHTLADALSEEPTLIAQLVRVAVHNSADGAIREVLPHRLRPLGDWVAAAGRGPRGAVTSGLRGEFALAAGVLANASALGDADLEAMGGAPSLGERLVWFVLHGDGARLLESYADLYAHRNDPYPALLERARTNDLQLADGGPGSSVIGIQLERLVEQEAKAATQRAVTEAGARLLEFRRRLDGLVPWALDEIPGVPTDPRTGEHLVLEINDQETVLQAADGEGRWVVPAPR